MKRTFFCVAFVATASLGAVPMLAQAESTAVCDRSPIVIRNARVWPGLDRADVLVRGGTIAEIGPPGTVDAPADARTLDAAGATLLPGLIDSHTHIDIWPGPRPERVELPGPEVAALQTLASGVTTVRNHLSDRDVVPRLVRESADDCAPMPRVVTGSRGLMGGQPNLDGRLMWGARDAADARAKVRGAAESGAGWVSVHRVVGFEPEVLEAIVDEASALGLRVMVEGASVDAVRLALEIGARSIDYIDQTAGAGYPDDLLAAWSGRETPAYAVPPMGYYSRVRAYAADPSGVHRPERLRFMPPGVGEALFAAQEEHFRDMAARGLPGYFDAVDARFRQLRDAGVPMVIGSDSGSGGQYHADAIWVELAAWRDQGVPVEEAIEAATALPARMLGLDDRGRIEVGARADLLLYRGDLSAGELDLEHVDTVIKGGVIHFRGGERYPGG